MSNNGTTNDIVYLDYRTSALSGTQNENTSKPDSLANIIKNNIVFWDNNVLTDNIIVI